MKRIQEIQGELKSQLGEDFDALYVFDGIYFLTQRTNEPLPPGHQIKPALIADACKVVDQLSDDFRLHLVDRYVALELKDYRRIFWLAEEAGQLDNISQRLASRGCFKHTSLSKAGFSQESGELDGIFWLGSRR